MQEQTHPHSAAAPVKLRHLSPSQQHTSTTETEAKVPSSSSLNTSSEIASNSNAKTTTTTTTTHNHNVKNIPTTDTHISTRPRPTTTTATSTTTHTQTPSSMACLANTVPIGVRAGTTVAGSGTRPLPLHPVPVPAPHPYPTHVLMMPRKPTPAPAPMPTHVPSSDVSVGVGIEAPCGSSNIHKGTSSTSTSASGTTSSNSFKRSRANTNITISNSEGKNENKILMGVENENNVHENIFSVSEPDAKMEMDSISRTSASASASAHENHSALYSLGVQAQEILEQKQDIQCGERDIEGGEKNKILSTSVLSQKQESEEAIIGNICHPSSSGGLNLGDCGVGDGIRHHHGHHDVVGEFNENSSSANRANSQEIYAPAGVGACISTSSAVTGHEQHEHEKIEHEQQHESSGSGSGVVEVQMTVEQIDDLIGKVDLPTTNFSFSLPSSVPIPISIAPKPAPVLPSVPSPAQDPVPIQPQMCKPIPASSSNAKSTSACPTDLSSSESTCTNSNALKRRAQSGSRKAPVLPLSSKRMRVDTSSNSSAGMDMGRAMGMSSLTVVRSGTTCTNNSASSVTPSMPIGYGYNKPPASVNNPEQASVGMSMRSSSNFGSQHQQQQQPQILPMHTCPPNTSANLASQHQISGKASHIASTSTSTSANTNTNMHLVRKSPSAGRWSREEHEAFLEGLKIFGREWKKVATKIPTRTSAQIRSHAQKYFAKLARDEQQQAASASLSLGTGMGMAGGGCTSINADGSNLGVGAGSGTSTMIGESLGGENISQSVLERVEKILEDPKGAQREVEETLRKLRARYSELQRDIIRQQQSQQQHQQQQQTEYKPTQLQKQQQQEEHIEPNVNVHNSVKGVNQNDSSGRTNYSCIGSESTPSTNIDSAALTQAQNMVEMAGSSSRMLDMRDQNRKITSTSDPSSVGATCGVATSSISPTRHRSNPITLSTQSLALHSEELIALHVLGGELYRSASRENLRAHDKNNQNIMNQNTQDTVMPNPVSSLQGSSPDTQSSEKTQKRENTSN